jgi:hypothetical protein
MNRRVLELARTESGQYRLLLEYLGNDLCELDKQSVLVVMDHVGTGALIEACQLHEATRTTRSLLFRSTWGSVSRHCEMSWTKSPEPLKTLGIHIKLTHDDPGSTSSAAPRLPNVVFPSVKANAHQVLATVTEHRLHIGLLHPALIITASGGLER